MRKSTIALAAVSCILFFMLLADMRKDPDRTPGTSHYIYNIDSREIQEIGVFKDGNRYVSLLRTGEQDWNITFPVNTKASEYSIAPILNFINDAMYTNIYSKESYENFSLESFGLENPPYRITFRAEGTQYAFRVSPVKKDDIYFLREDQPGKVYVAPRHFFNYFNADFNEYRVRTVFSFNDINVSKFEIKGETELTVAKPARGLWNIEVPFHWPGAPDMIAVYMNALKSLRIKEFVKDGASEDELKLFGISGSKNKVILHFAYTPPVSMTVGKKDSGRNIYYFTVDGSGSVFTAEAGAIEALITPDIKLFRNRDLGVFDPSLVRHIEVVYANDRQPITMERAALAAMWKCTWPKDEKIGTERVNDFISNFLETKIVNFTMEGKDKIPVFDLDKPDISITFSGTTGPGRKEELYRLFMKKKGKDLVYGYIAGTDSILRLSEKLYAELDRGLITFKSLYILPEIDQDVTWFAISGKNRVRVEGRLTDSRNWDIVEPTNKLAVPEEIYDMIDTLSLLRADSIVTLNIGNYRDYGLDDPAVEVSFIGKGVRFDLQIGNKTENSSDSYVKLKSSDAVFTLSKDKIDHIAKDPWNLIKLK